MAAAAWSCLSSEKISDKKNTEIRQKRFSNKDVGITMIKSIQTKCMAVCNKGRDDGTINTKLTNLHLFLKYFFVLYRYTVSAYQEMEPIGMMYCCTEIAIGGSSDDDQLYQMSQRLEPRERWQSERLTLVRSHRVLSAARLHINPE